MSTRLGGITPRPWYRAIIVLATGEIIERGAVIAPCAPQESSKCIYGTSGRAGGQSAISQEHANKMAIEARQAWLRRVTEP